MLNVERGDRKISTYNHRVVLYFTPNDAIKVENYLAETGMGKNFFVDLAIREFLESNVVIEKEPDARNLDYEGEKKTNFIYAKISDVTEVLFDIKTQKNKISRSALGARAVLDFIDKENLYD